VGAGKPLIDVSIGLGVDKMDEVIIDGVTYHFREDVHYSADGLWVAVDGQVARVGVGDHLRESISPGLSFIELREAGTRVKQGEEMGSFDMVKADVPILSPVSGIIRGINEELVSNLWLLDQDPYGQGWLAVFDLTNFAADRVSLLDVHAYRAMLRVGLETRKPILFLSAGDSGLSQMAQALFYEASQGRRPSLSAGMVPAMRINPRVAEAMRALGIDVAGRQPSLLTSEMIDKAGRIIALGCGAEDLGLSADVPVEEWQLENPKGQTLEEIRGIRDQVRQKVSQLLRELDIS
jgi:arsenate reductase